MKNKSPKGLRNWTLLLLLLAALAVLGSGYWLYQRSIEKAVHSTTVSFMKQLADHDHLNIINQMNSKWEYLTSMLERLKYARSPAIEDVIYELGLDARTTSFKTIYLVIDDDLVYNSSYLESSLEEMVWSDIFKQSDGVFVTTYNENSREQWGEYIIYGIRLNQPVVCGDRNITGIIGMVPISEIAGQMRMESFDGLGIAMVIQPTGEIITASQYYGSDTDKNFLTSLESADFKNGVTKEACQAAIERGESLFVEYQVENEEYYALFQPMEHHGGSDWYLVVRVSALVTVNQVRILILRSLPFFLLLGLMMLAIACFIYRIDNSARIARASEQAKSSFLANMSHEIRTPLNGIMGIQHLMHQNLDNPAKLQELLSKADISAEYLKSVITDVLDMSKIENGQLEIYNSEMNLVKVAREIEVLIGMQASDKGLYFHVEFQDVSHPTVLGDELRIKQVLTNLLGNSLKFTPRGGDISLTLTQRINGASSTVIFIVADTGSGMSPEFLEKIWLPFEQEHRIASQNGTGLGTTLSRILVEKMGGSISVESSPGVGTTFTISLPLTLTEASEASEETAKEAETSLQDKHILVAEDNEINMMILVSVLTQQGCHVTEAVNGKEAVRLLENSPPGFYDLILMDIQMPVMNGYEAARTIRSLPRPDCSQIPIMAMTANAFREDVDKALRCGMDDVATKPLDVTILLNKIRKLHLREKTE